MPHDVLSMSAAIEDAIDAILKEFANNPWMLNEHWPLIAHHVRRCARDANLKVPAQPTAHVLDVACGNGYVARLHLSTTRL